MEDKKKEKRATTFLKSEITEMKWSAKEDRNLLLRPGKRDTIHNVRSTLAHTSLRVNVIEVAAAAKHEINSCGFKFFEFRVSRRIS